MSSPEYRVIRRQVLTIAQGLPTEAKQTLVTYVTRDLPPYTLFLAGVDIPPDEEDRYIRTSIEARQAERIGR